MSHITKIIKEGLIRMVKRKKQSFNLLFLLNNAIKKNIVANDSVRIASLYCVIIVGCKTNIKEYKKGYLLFFLKIIRETKKTEIGIIILTKKCRILLKKNLLK